MSSIAAAWYPCATNTCWAAARSCLRRAERGRRTGLPVACVPLVVEVISTVSNHAPHATYRAFPFTVASRQATEERTVDETGQPGAEATAGGNDGGDREGAYEHQSWSSSDSRESSFDAQDGGRRSPTTGRSAVGSARVNGDNTSIRARSDLRPSQHEQLAPVTPLNAWERRGRIPNGAEPPADQVNGARPLTLAEHSAMMDNLPYADRRSTSDGPAGQSPSGYFSARPASPAGGTPSGEYPRSGPAGGERTPPLLVSAPTRPDRPLPGQPPADRPGHSGYASPAGPVSSPAGPFPPLTTDRRTEPPATPTAPGVDPATSRGLPTAPRSAPPFPGLSPTTATSIGSAAVPPTTTSIGSAAVAPTSIGSAAVPPVAPLPPPLPASGPTSGPPLRPV